MAQSPNHHAVDCRTSCGRSAVQRRRLNGSRHRPSKRPARRLAELHDWTCKVVFAKVEIWSHWTKGSSASGAAKIIVVIGRQRSGTTVFRELLATNGADDVGEIFHADFKDSPRNFFWYLANKARQDVAALHPTGFSRLFEEFLQENILRDRAAKALIDIKYNALRFIDGDIIEKTPVAIKLLADRGATFLQIIRRNKLRVVISLLIAQKTGQWRSATTADRGDQRRRVRVSAARGA